MQTERKGKSCERQTDYIKGKNVRCRQTEREKAVTEGQTDGNGKRHEGQTDRKGKRLRDIQSSRGEKM